MKDANRNNKRETSPLFWHAVTRIRMGSGATHKLVADVQAYTRHNGAQFEIAEEHDAATGRELYALTLAHGSESFEIGKYDTQEQAREAAETINADVKTVELLERVTLKKDELNAAAAELMKHARETAPRGRAYHGTRAGR